MKDWAADFYKGRAWQACRRSYLESVSGLCEGCLARGEITPAEIVHHKIILTAENIDRPEITMNFANLEAVCRKCHGERHGGTWKRYEIDGAGHVRII